MRYGSIKLHCGRRHRLIQGFAFDLHLRHGSLRNTHPFLAQTAVPGARRLFTTQKPQCAKSQSSVKFKALAQRSLINPSSGQDPRQGRLRYPTVMQEAWDNIQKFEDCVVLTKVGGFYELYFEQAQEYGPLLNLKVALKKIVGGSVPMAGFPFFQLDRFLKILVQDLKKHVAISEEFPRNPADKVKSGGLLFDRRVVRVITPGTLVDEKFMHPSENNFLLVVYSNGRVGAPMVEPNTSPSSHDAQPVGLAWLDLSTGEFFTQSTNISSLSSELLRINAREIVLSRAMSNDVAQRIQRIIGTDNGIVTWYSKPLSHSTVAAWAPRLESPVSPIEAAQFTEEEIAAGGILLDFVKDKLLDSGVKLQAPVKRKEAENMSIDRNSMRGLEIFETSQATTSGGKGSLLHSIRRTVTRSGARLLRERISSPSTSLTLINQRLDLVQIFVDELSLRESIVSLLRRTFDSQRLAQKFALGRGDADDLISLHRTILASQEVTNLLARHIEGIQTSVRDSLSSQLSRFSLESPLCLAGRIAGAIDEDALIDHQLTEQVEAAQMISKAQDVLSSEGSDSDVKALSRISKNKGQAMKNSDRGSRTSEEDTIGENEASTEDQYLNETSTTMPSSSDGVMIEGQQESWTMRRNANPTLERLHGDLDILRNEKESLASKFRNQSGAASLSLRWTPGLGHICHVKGARDVRASIERLGSARSVGSSKSTRTFYLTEWTSLGCKIDQVRLQIRAEEQKVFQSLREEVVHNLVKLRGNATVLDELDIACSFATLASEKGFTRPILNNSRSHRIIAGQHPTVMLGLEAHGRAFVSNDCLVGDKERIWLITGPNMAGKSTFLRQNALISVLAQVGSFVPAKYAEIGIVDQIFSRIGSADNLYQDQSTFMIEMLETAQILTRATPRSFVIMDEVGRGTTPEDGVAISYACLHHLYKVNKCRTLFATHFHALADMTSDWSSLGTYCTDVREAPDGSFSYIHRLRSGVNRESHALKVARLAGIPEDVIAVAFDAKASLTKFEIENTKENDTE